MLLAEERGFASCAGKGAGAEEGEAMREALERAFLRMDAQVLNRARAEGDRDGSCALIAVRVGALSDMMLQRIHWGMTPLLSEDSIAASRTCLAAMSHGSLSITGFVKVKGRFAWNACCLLPLRPRTTGGCGIDRHALLYRPTWCSWLQQYSALQASVCGLRMLGIAERCCHGGRWLYL